jgi:hypothetical protein
LTIGLRFAGFKSDAPGRVPLVAAAWREEDGLSDCALLRNPILDLGFGGNGSLIKREPVISSLKHGKECFNSGEYY